MSVEGTSTSVVQGHLLEAVSVECWWEALARAGRGRGKAMKHVESLTRHQLAPKGIQRTKLLGLWLSFETAVLGCEGWLVSERIRSCELEINCFLTPGMPGFLLRWADQKTRWSSADQRGERWSRQGRQARKRRHWSRERRQNRKRRADLAGEAGLRRLVGLMRTTCYWAGGTAYEHEEIVLVISHVLCLEQGRKWSGRSKLEKMEGSRQS